MFIRRLIQILPLWIFLKATESTSPLPCHFSWNGKDWMGCGAVELDDGVYICRVSTIEWKRKRDKLLNEADYIHQTYLKTHPLPNNEVSE